MLLKCVCILDSHRKEFKMENIDTLLKNKITDPAKCKNLRHSCFCERCAVNKNKNVKAKLQE